MALVSLSPNAWTPGFGMNDLNSLPNGGLAVSTLSAPQLDNSAGGNLFVEFEVTLGALSPSGSATILAFLIPETTTPGTYVTGGTGTTTADHYRWQNGPYGIIALRLTAGTGQIQRSSLVQIAACRYMVGVINRANVALAASGNQVMFRTYAELVA